MLTRTLRSRCAAPLRQIVPARLSRRAVTTDAASSHADKEHVPSVSRELRQRSESFALELIRVCGQEDDKPFEVRLSDESFETYELDPPPYTLQTTKAELRRMYFDMVRIRYGWRLDFHTAVRH